MVYLASTVHPQNIFAFSTLIIEACRLTLDWRIPMNISPYFSAPLHQRINEDMILRKLATKTQIAYIRGVNKLCEYLQHHPETTTQEALRVFQLFMVNHSVSGITVNATLTALKFLFQIILDKPDLMDRIFDELGLDVNCKKVSEIYEQYSYYGAIAS
jgi:hypothetical protein